MVETVAQPRRLASFHDSLALSQPGRESNYDGKRKSTKIVGDLSDQTSFIARRGWKSSHHSPLPVEEEIFFWTLPFIEQAFALFHPEENVFPDDRKAK